jgi:hypothetical protein
LKNRRPRQTFTVRFCPVCSRDELAGGRLNVKHFSGGKLCQGKKLCVATYRLEGVRDENPDSEPD